MATKQQQIAQLEDKLRQLRTEMKNLNRRGETRRKILYGAALLALADSLGPERGRALMQRVDPFVSRNVDREFLGLAPLKQAEEPAPSAGGRRTVDATPGLPFGD